MPIHLVARSMKVVALSAALFLSAPFPIQAQSTYLPVTVVDDSGVQTTFTAPPRRIVSLNPGHTVTWTHLSRRPAPGGRRGRQSGRPERCPCGFTASARTTKRSWSHCSMTTASLSRSFPGSCVISRLEGARRIRSRRTPMTFGICGPFLQSSNLPGMSSGLATRSGCWSTSGQSRAGAHASDSR